MSLNESNKSIQKAHLSEITSSKCSHGLGNLFKNRPPLTSRFSVPRILRNTTLLLSALAFLNCSDASKPGECVPPANGWVKKESKLCDRSSKCPSKDTPVKNDPKICEISTEYNSRLILIKQKEIEFSLAENKLDYVALLYVSLSENYFEICDYEKMDSFLAKAKDMADSLLSKKVVSEDLAETYRMLGAFFFERKGNYPAALDMFETSRSLYGSLKKEKELADVMIPLSRLHFCMGDKIKSISFEIDVIAIAEGLADSSKEGEQSASRIFDSLAALANSNGEPMKAAQYYERSGELYRSEIESNDMFDPRDLKVMKYLLAIEIYCCNGDECGIRRVSSKVQQLLDGGYKPEEFSTKMIVTLLDQIEAIGCKI